MLTDSLAAATITQPVLRALVVEDSELDFELLVAHLKRHYRGLTTTRVEDEATLRAAFSRQVWDIVLADHNLPRFSSSDALQLTKQFAADLPFIIVSGLIGEDVAVDAMHSGADDYVKKDQLGRLIPAIERSRQAAEIRRLKHEAETSLEEKRSQLAAITANMPGVIFQLEQANDDAPIRLAYVSDAAAKFLGLDDGKFRTHDRIWQQLFAPEDLAGLIELLHQSRIEQKVLRWEGRLGMRWLPAGERRARWVELAATPRTTRDGKTLFDGVLIDITQHKRTEGLLARSRQQMRELSAHLEHVKEQERAAIAREVHDDIGGTLTGLKVDVAWLRKHFDQEPAVLGKLEDMETLVNTAFDASKRIMLTLRPSVLDFGIVPAMEWLVQEFKQRHATACAFECNSDDLPLAADVSSALFRILQESLTNIAKHARATHVEVQLFADDDMVSLEVSDNGVGFDIDARAKPGAFGIRGIHERVEQLNGWIEIHSRQNSGTTLMLSVPRELPLAN
jgi:two-component system, NarL family, sensor histidine kinase UhpB